MTCCKHCDHDPGYVHAESCLDPTCPAGGPDSRPEFAGAASLDDPPEYDPEDAEAQRIAEDFAQAAAEAHWTDTGEAGRG